MNKEGVVLIGMAGVGKSTIGRVLAKELGWDFVDLDVYLTRKIGKTPQRIIDEQGESALLELEKQGLLEIGLKHRVVSPGGGIVGLRSKTLREIYLERQPQYVRYADVVIDLRGKDSQEAVSEIVTRLKNESCQ